MPSTTTPARSTSPTCAPRSCLPQDDDNISVCNLASINLSTAPARSTRTARSASTGTQIDESARSAVRQLDNLIDITALVASTEADHANTAEPRDRPRRHGLHRRRREARLQLRERRGVRPDRRDHGARLVRRDRRVGRPRPGARLVHELRGQPLVAGARAVRLDRAHRGRPRHRDQGQPHDPPRLGRAAREGQGRHAQRDAHGDRAHGIHRSGRRHHARVSTRSSRRSSAAPPRTASSSR